MLGPSIFWLSEVGLWAIGPLDLRCSEPWNEQDEKCLCFGRGFSQTPDSFKPDVTPPIPLRLPNFLENRLMFCKFRSVGVVRWVIPRRAIRLRCERRGPCCSTNRPLKLSNSRVVLAANHPDICCNDKGMPSAASSVKKRYPRDF